MRLEEELKKEEVKESKSGQPIRLDKHWLGYVVITCAVALSLVVLIGNIAACGGIKMASLPSLSNNNAVTVEAKTADTESTLAIPAKTGEEKMIKISSNKPVDKPKPPETGGDEENVKKWHFYNLDLQDDGQVLNDYDFGPNPILDQVDLDKVKEAVKGKKASDTVKVQDIIQMLDTEQVKAEMITRMRNDPKLAAATMAWMDCKLGTRFMGVFYSESKEKWDVAMNLAADTWIDDPAAFVEVMTNFEKKLDHANKVEMRYVSSGLTDQMYMEPNGMNAGVPDIIVMDTANHDGWFIVYTYIIKETKTIEVIYRVDCGFQPTNVAEVMKITPKKNPQNKNKKTKKSSKQPVQTPTTSPAPQVSVTGGGSSSSVQHSESHHHHDNPDPIPIKPDPDPAPVPPGPDPMPVPDPKDPDPIPVPPDPTPNPPKDPTNGTPVLPNDDSGPGENTNNPDNPDYSTKDQDTNSNHMTQEQYDKAMEDNHWANEVGKEGGDSNTPSTPTPPNTNMDNNGGSIGYTPPSDSSVSNDPSWDAWDGPPDGDSGSSSGHKKGGSSDRPSPD